LSDDLTDTQLEYKRAHEEFLAIIGHEDEYQLLQGVKTAKWLQIATTQQQRIIGLEKRLYEQEVANNSQEKNLRAKSKMDSRERFSQGFQEGVILSTVLGLGLAAWFVIRFS
jgi:hypothetical protein